MIIITPKEIKKKLFTGKPLFDDSIETRFRYRGGGSVKDLVGKESYVWLGVPNIYLLEELYEKSGNKLAPVFQIELEKFDLVVLHFACSFRQSNSSQFVKACVKIQLGSDDKNSYKPVAYDLFPKEISLPIKFQKKFSVKPDITMEFNQIMQAQMSAFEKSNSKEFYKYEPEVTAFGKGASKFGWDFNKSISRPITGIKDLFVLIKKPKRIALEVRFDITASLKTYLGVIPVPFFMNSSNRKPIIEEKHKFEF